VIATNPTTAPTPPESASHAVRSPRWRRWLRRYPDIRQHDATDCGAACLAMITAYHGHPVGVARLRDLANVDADGCSMWSLARAAETLGFHARGLQLDFEALSGIQVPAIVHWEGFHYIVLYKVARGHVVVSDPAMGRRRISKAEFLAGWTGKALELVPTRNLTLLEARTCSWRRFLPIMRPYRAMVGEVFAASLLLSILGLGIPMFTQMVIDRVLVNRSVDLLNMLLGGMLLVAVFQAMIKSVRQLLLVHVSIRADARLIGDFFRQVFRLPMRFFDLRRVGDVVSRVSENRKIRAAMAGTIPGVALDATLAIGYFAVLAWYSPSLTLVVLAVLPVFAGLTFAFTPALRRNEKEQFARRTDATTYLIESVTGMSTVKAMAIEPQVRWRLESLYIDSLLAARRGAHLTTGYSGLATLVQTTAAVIFLWYGAHQVMNHAMTAGQLLAFVAIAGNVVTPIVNLIVAWDELQEVRNAVDRLNDVFESAPEEDNGRTLLTPSRLQGRICLENVTFSYKGDEDELALTEVNLDIAAGETVALVGRSGSGKSTLARLILGLYEPTRGRITLDGNDLRTISRAALRRRMGVVPQEIFLFSGTIRENIAVGEPEVSFEEVVEAARRAGAHEFISEMGMGYDTKVGERGMSLSGGQRQRIALARALLRNPDLLILDEATSSLDNISDRAIQRNLEQAAAGRTTLVIAHRLSTVRYADRIVVMDAGRIVEEGTHEQLLRCGGLYTTLIGQQLNQ